MVSKRTLLLTVVSISLFVLPAAPSWAHAVPSNPLLFEMPFRCGQDWNVATYTGHGDDDHATDWNQGAGSADLGKPVVASYRGTVTIHPLAANDSVGPILNGGRPGPYGVEGAGNYVVIDHGNGWSTRYLHLESITVSNGTVSRGQQIGTVGGTGTPNNSAVHLHYEQEFNGVDQHVTFNGQPITYSKVYNGPLYRSHNCSDGIAAARSVSGDRHWFVDYDRDEDTNQYITFGWSTDRPVSGDWNGDGGEGVGVFRPADGDWFLDFDNNGVSNDRVTYGTNGDTPLAGDWNDDGEDDIGVFRPSIARFFLDIGRDGTTDDYIYYGAPSDIAVAGDWDNNGRDGIGVFRPSTGTWFLDNNSDGVADQTVGYGKNGDAPVVGDWDGDGDDNLGVFRASEALWYLDYNNNGVSDATVAYGAAGDRVVGGDFRSP